MSTNQPSLVDGLALHGAVDALCNVDNEHVVFDGALNLAVYLLALDWDVAVAVSFEDHACRMK